MNIAFFTEAEFKGKIPRNHPNMRTDLAWICSLQSDHFPLEYTPNITYDLSIIIIPKLNPEKGINLIDRMGDDYVSKIKKFSNKVAIMQEGPHWFFQDYSVENQIWYFNQLSQSDILFVHNKIDKNYFEGLLNHPNVKVLPTLMIEDLLKTIPIKDINHRKETIIGGGFNYWYSGFDSYIIAQEFSTQVYSPPMRKKKNEEAFPNLNHLPYVNWIEWMKNLNNFKYAVHLMRTHAAGTFALNCAYLGIPCIGYKGLDTQETCHPLLSVEVGDLKSARKLAQKLKKDFEFYKENSILTKQLYKQHYHENKFNTTFKKQFKIS